MARFNNIHGCAIHLSNDDTQATRKGDDPYDNCIIFSSSVLSKGETFSVNVMEAEVSNL